MDTVHFGYTANELRAAVVHVNMVSILVSTQHTCHLTGT